jgi:O-antigen/teichoic acid export membrane protein
MGQDRETFKHAFIYSSAAILSKMIGFIMLPVYAHVLRDLGYGVISMVDSTMSVLLSLMAYSMRGTVIRIYHEQPAGERRRAISTGTILVAAIAGGLMGLTALISHPLSRLMLGDASYAPLLRLASLAFFFELSGQAASAILLIERKSIYFSSMGLLRMVIGVSLNIYLILVLKMGLLGYFLASLATSVVPGLMFFAIAVKKCGLAFDRKIAADMLRFQLPLVPSSIINTISRQAERVLARFMINIESVGILSMGYKFPVLLTILIHEPFMKSWNTERIAIADQPKGPERIGRMFTYSLYLLVFAGLVMAAAIQDLLMILTPPEFWLAYRIARIEILTVLLINIRAHLTFGLLYAKDTKTWAIMRSVMSVIKIGLSFLFISLWGLYGAAYSACVVAFLTLLWGLKLGQARYRITLETRKILLLSGAAVLLFALLTRIDFRESGLVQSLSAGAMPRIADFLTHTPLGTWKEGKGIVLLQERADLLLDMMLKTLVAGFYILLFPLAHDPTAQRLRRWLRSASRRGGPPTPGIEA